MTQAQPAGAMKESSWSMRFIWAAIVQGVFAVGWTITIVLPTLNPSIAEVIASGSAGTWFLTGYVLYIAVGVIASGLTALFYYHFEVIRGKAYRGIANGLAWLHLLLMTGGTAAATWSLMYAGYIGEAALMPVREGGKAMTAEQVHSQILVQWVDPIAIFLLIATLGVVCGGLGFLITYFRK